MNYFFPQKLNKIYLKYFKKTFKLFKCVCKLFFRKSTIYSFFTNYINNQQTIIYMYVQYYI